MNLTNIVKQLEYRPTACVLGSCPTVWGQGGGHSNPHTLVWGLEWTLRIHRLSLTSRRGSAFYCFCMALSGFKHLGS